MEEQIYVGSRIRRIRGGLSRDEFARIVSVHPQTLARWEKDETRPDSDVLHKICVHFNINPVWLLMGHGEMEANQITVDDQGLPVQQSTELEEIRTHLQSLRRLVDQTPLMAESLPSDIKIPPPEKINNDDFYYQFPLVEGFLSEDRSSFVTMAEGIKSIPFRKDWIDQAKSNPKKAIMTTVHGDSMEPVIMDGDIIMVDTGQKRIFDGYIYALAVGVSIVIKRLYFKPNGLVRVRSDNPEYEPYESAPDDLRVIGEVKFRCGPPKLTPPRRR